MATTEQTEAKAVGLSVLVPEPMRTAIAELAEADGRRSIGSMTRVLLGEALKRRAAILESERRANGSRQVDEDRELLAQLRRESR